MPKTLTALAISQTAAYFDDVSGKLVAPDDEGSSADPAVGMGEAATVSPIGDVEMGRDNRDMAAAAGPAGFAKGAGFQREAGVQRAARDLVLRVFREPETKGANGLVSIFFCVWCTHCRHAKAAKAGRGTWKRALRSPA